MAARALMLAVTGALLASCRCEPPVGPTSSAPLNVLPTELAFADTFLGGHRTLTLELTNPTRSRKVLSLEIPSPFSGPAAVEVAGGETVALELTFAPTSEGEARATVLIDTTEVVLHGVGLAPLECGEAACEVRRFDPESGRCESIARPDGTACSMSCLTSGRCQQGVCEGTVSAECQSNDPCVVDGCGVNGCVHAPRECPVNDPCQAVYCDPSTGCQSQAVEDGVPCGADTCETATICLNGRCERRVKPDAADRCRYVELASSRSATCGVTRGGQLRCWGSNQTDVLGRGFSSRLAGPGEALGISNAVHVATSTDFIWVAQGSEAQQVGRSLALPLPASAGLAAGGGMVCGLEGGTVSCAPERPADAGLLVTGQAASRLSMSGSILTSELCVIVDAGVHCGAPAALAPRPLPGPASEVSVLEQDTGCALVEGAGTCWSADGGLSVLWDAGVTAIGSFGQTSRGRVCAVVDGGVQCSAFSDDGDAYPGVPVPVPHSDELGPIAQLSMGDGHGCLLLADGRVACWGGNLEGQLGDRSAQPRGLQELPFRASWMGLEPWTVQTFAGPDGGVFAFRGEGVSDGGVSWTRASVTELGRPTSDFEGRCVTRLGRSYCAELGPLPLGQQPGLFVRQPPGVCAASAAGVVQCWQYSSPEAVEVPSAGGDAGGPLSALECANTECAGYCAVRLDGVVRCFNDGGGEPPPAALTSVAQLCMGASGQGGCVVRTNGELACWGPWVGSPGVAIRPPGSWPLVREVRCGAQHFCALSGSNIVQCWGNNEMGQLGRDGPGSTQASSVPMPEPVRRLAARSVSTCALLQSGRVLCWGDNRSANLGVPVLTSSERPLLVTQ